MIGRCSRLGGGVGEQLTCHDCLGRGCHVDGALVC